MNENKNNLLGYLGGLIGALIATIPWVLIYVYAGWILSLLAIPIAYGSLKGYKLLGGKINKITPVMVIVTTIVSITVATFVIIPLLMLHNEGGNVSFDNLKYLYSSGDFMRAMAGDYVISLIFAALGISGVVRSVNNEAKNPEGVAMLRPDGDAKDIEKIKKIFAKYEAFDKAHAIDRYTLENELDIENKNVIINKLKMQYIIRGNNKLYFDDKAYQDPVYAAANNRKQGLKIAGIIIAILLVLLTGATVLYTMFGNSSDKEFNIDGTYVNIKLLDYASVKIPKYLDEYGAYTDSEYFNERGYYRFVYVPNDTDYDKAIIKTLFIDYLPDYYYNDYDEYVKYYKDNSKDTYHVTGTNYKDLGDDLELIEIIADNKVDKEIYYDYYLFYKGESIFFEFVVDDDANIKVLKQVMNKIIDSVKWSNNNI